MIIDYWGWQLDDDVFVPGPGPGGPGGMKDGVYSKVLIWVVGDWTVVRSEHGVGWVLGVTFIGNIVKSEKLIATILLRFGFLRFCRC